MLSNRPNRSTLVAAVAGAALFAAVTLIGCSTPSTDGAAPATTAVPDTPVLDGSLTVGIIGSPDGFNPGSNRWTPATNIIAKAVYDPIAVLGDDGQVYPYLAESITPNAEFTVWDIKVRSNITFHNGEPLNADAVKLNVDNLTRGLLTAQATTFITSTDVIDPLTVRINLSSPNAHLPYSMTGQAGWVVAPEQIRSTNPDTVIGTGPFKKKEWLRDNRFDVVRNDQYWQKDNAGRPLPYLASVSFRMLPDANSREAALKAGDVNLIQTANASTIQGAQTGRLGNVQNLVDTRTADKGFLTLNTAQGPFTDRRLRAAAAAAVNKQTFINTVLNDSYQPATGPMTPGSPWGDPTNMPAYDPEGARSLVRDVTGGAPAKVTFTVPAGDADTLAQAQLLQQQLNAVGFDVQINSVELTTFTLNVVNGQSDMFLFVFWTDTDPDALTTFLTSETAKPVGQIGLNFARWSTPEVDKAMAAARSSNDDQFRRAQYQKVWDAMGNDNPYVFIYVNKWAILWTPEVYNVGRMVTPEGVPMAPEIWGSLALTNVWTAGS